MLINGRVFTHAGGKMQKGQKIETKSAQRKEGRREKEKDKKGERERENEMQFASCV